MLLIGIGYFNPGITLQITPIARFALLYGFTVAHIVISIFLKVHQILILSIRTRYTLINGLMRFGIEFKFHEIFYFI